MLRIFRLLAVFPLTEVVTLFVGQNVAISSGAFYSLKKYPREKKNFTLWNSLSLLFGWRLKKITFKN